MGEIARLADMRQANVSQHLALLRSKKLVVTRREGVTIFYSLANERILQAFDIVTEVLLERLADTEKISKSLRKAQAR